MTTPFQHAARRARPLEVLPPVELTTDRLLFRPLARIDRSGVLAALQHSRRELLDTIPLNRAGESDASMFDRWVETTIETDNNRTAWRRAAFLDNGAFVGIFNLIKIETGLEWSCEASWWVDRRLCGRGLATEGVEGILELALADMPVGLGLSRVTAMIQPDNAPSIRIAERAGMRHTGGVDLLEINGSSRAHLAFERTV